MRRVTRAAVAAVVLLALSPAAHAEDRGRLPLRAGWSLQSSAHVRADGRALSVPGAPVDGWHRVRVPNTVVGALVENGVYPDPYFGMNLRSIPGTTYPIGERFTLLPTPDDSPFKPSWWYRAEFDLPADYAGRHVWLHFDGINYRANVWLNGRRIAAADELVGAFRRFQFDVTSLARAGARNALAIEVFGPNPDDLSFMWVDWNPTPPDKNMGLWGEVYLTTSGPVALRHPYVNSALNLPSLASASLTVGVEAWNATDRPLTASIRGEIEGRAVRQEVALAPKERRTVRFLPDKHAVLVIARPRVWWPYRMGEQPLYRLTLEAEVDGQRSDTAATSFGIQQMTSELTKEGSRLFRINGRPLLVRGGGWTSDMLLRPATTERLEAELRYVREMGLNTIRLEGKLETDEFYDLADKYGILLMPGWCCCDQWELWDKWDEEDHRVGPASLRDQALRLRGHPSVLVWLNGSDFPPPAKVEGAYLDVLKQCDWQKPILSNATEAPGALSGPSGVKMRGPYDYVPPAYWLRDSKFGGAHGFATEVGPGAAVPPVDSLKRMLPADQLWPINDTWRFHAGGDQFKDLKLFTEALEARYGKATSIEDYARKAQALAYEGQRAMFEAFGRNKYVATGVIQWMLNNAWPSMIWHLYDHYLRPAGGYYGTKKANELLHVQYSYDDRSIAIVNERHEPARGLKVKAEVFDIDLVPKFLREAQVDVPSDGVARAFVLPEMRDISTTYFLRLTLSDAAGREASRNFYWLATRDDALDWANTKWYYTPTAQHADLTALSRLPPTTLSVHATHEANTGPEGVSRVTVENTGAALAFQVRLKLVDATGEERLPVFWDDNYVALFPGERRELRVAYPRGPSAAPLHVEGEAWNVPPKRY